MPVCACLHVCIPASVVIRLRAQVRQHQPASRPHARPAERHQRAAQPHANSTCAGVSPPGHISIPVPQRWHVPGPHACTCGSSSACTTTASCTRGSPSACTTASCTRRPAPAHCTAPPEHPRAWRRRVLGFQPPCRLQRAWIETRARTSSRHPEQLQLRRHAVCPVGT